MRNYWISWYGDSRHSAFELYSPWWQTGYDSSDRTTLVAAVKAETEDAARDVIESAYDERPQDLEFRFVELRPDDWSPFSSRFPRAEWMRWGR